jgi:hypothetical protein
MKAAQEKSHKVKIGTILDKDIIRRLKERSARERRPISALIEEAVLRVEQDEMLSKELRVRALESAFAIKFNISDEQLRVIMDEDYYDQ